MNATELLYRLLSDHDTNANLPQPVRFLIAQIGQAIAVGQSIDLERIRTLLVAEGQVP